MNRSLPPNLLVAVFLRVMATQFNLRPSLRRYLRGTDGWINFSVGFPTDTGSVEQSIDFHDGRAGVSGRIAAARLLPYNPMWLEKLVKIGAASTANGHAALRRWMTRQEIRGCEAIFRDPGIAV